jgi:poly [ADP-ribose] polymerase
MKGKVPIDDHVPLNKADWHVLEHQGRIYSATLNQTNVLNNNNKFYIIQILQSDSNSNHCYFFTRWGRVGVPGQFSNVGVMPIGSAIAQFTTKLYEKNKKGDYREIDLNYGN